MVIMYKLKGFVLTKDDGMQPMVPVEVENWEDAHRKLRFSGFDYYIVTLDEIPEKEEM